MEITLERDATHELRDAAWLALSIVVTAAIGRPVLPDGDAARLVFDIAVVGYVAVVRLRLRGLPDSHPV